MAMMPVDEPIEPCATKVELELELEDNDIEVELTCVTDDAPCPSMKEDAASPKLPPRWCW